MERLFWVDMEMTGLDVEKEVIIEVAAIVTDLNLEPIHNYHSVVKQPQHYLSNMDDWNSKHHRESGLLSLIPSGRSPDQVENDLLAIVDEFFPDERAVIAGNSISQDRLFIDKYFRRLSQRLHYRMLDVTAWKVVFANMYGIVHKKANAHRAVDDIRESIGELKLYLSYISAERIKASLSQAKPKP